MFEQKCIVCKNEITSDKDEIHLMDEHGFTHTFCSRCSEEAKKKLKSRDDSIRGR